VEILRAARRWRESPS